MVHISRVDDWNILFNGNTCAAVYKAAAGRDERGEFVLISEAGGEYVAKIRIGELCVNGTAYSSNDSANDATCLLNQFIGGNLGKGGNGSSAAAIPKIVASNHAMLVTFVNSLAVDDNSLISGDIIELNGATPSLLFLYKGDNPKDVSCYAPMHAQLEGDWVPVVNGMYSGFMGDFCSYVASGLFVQFTGRLRITAFNESDQPFTVRAPFKAMDNMRQQVNVECKGVDFSFLGSDVTVCNVYGLFDGSVSHSFGLYVHYVDNTAKLMSNVAVPAKAVQVGATFTFNGGYYKQYS